MLVFAAVGVFGAGMLAIAAGIPIKDFGYGNTLILSGVMAWCTSAIMLSLWAGFRELKKSQSHQGQGLDLGPAGADPRAAAPSAPTLPPGWPEAIPERAQPAPAAPPAPPPPVPASPPVREPRRNLLFTSSRRAKDGGPRDITAPADAGAPPAPTSNPSPDVRPAAASDESRSLPRRSELPPRPPRPSATIAPREPAPLPPPAPPPPVAPVAHDEAPRENAPLAIPAAPPREPERPARSDSANVSVLKSGVVDGMAYWLYSDGSIEAQMPEGMMRFTSIDELRAHLDKRP